MTKEQFIEQIAQYVIKYAPKYNIKVYSPIIAQAILESAYGTSELAQKANNYFGLKYRAGRCPTCIDVYIKVGSEQNADGSYVSSSMTWCKFKDMENGVIGYFDFTNISNYSNLKGVTDPYQYLVNIKADGYATSLKYVDNLMRVIEEWNLTKYDAAVAPTQPTTDLSPQILTPYRVRKSWSDSKSQLGAYNILNNAIEKCKANPGYFVYDANGTQVYPEPVEVKVEPPAPPAFKEYIVKPFINIYSEPTDASPIGKIYNGTFTIIEETKDKKYGKIKDLNVWIELSNVEKCGN